MTPLASDPAPIVSILFADISADDRRLQKCASIKSLVLLIT